MRKPWITILAVTAFIAFAGAAWWLVGPIAVSVVTPTRGPADEVESIRTERDAGYVFAANVEIGR